MVVGDEKPSPLLRVCSNALRPEAVFSISNALPISWNLVVASSELPFLSGWFFKAILK